MMNVVAASVVVVAFEVSLYNSKQFITSTHIHIMDTLLVQVGSDL